MKFLCAAEPQSWAEFHSSGILTQDHILSKSLSTHNICFFCGEIRKYYYFLAEKSSLSRIMVLTY